MSSDDFNVIIDKNWIMGCNNKNECDAIGLQYNDVYVENDYYIVSNWNVTKKPTFDILFSFYGLNRDTDVDLCNDFICKRIKGKYKIKKTYDGNKNYFLFSISISEIKNYSYFYINDKHKKVKISIVSLLNNYSKIPIQKTFEQSTNVDVNIYQWTSIEDIIEADQLKKHLGQEYSSDFIEGSLFTFANGDKIMFVHFDEEVHGSFLAFKDTGKGFQPFTPLNKALNEQIGGWAIVSNGIGGLVVDRYHHDFIRISNTQGFWSCGEDVKLSYNGDNFFIQEISVMPFCSNVLIDDWISVYKY